MMQDLIIGSPKRKDWDSGSINLFLHGIDIRYACNAEATFPDRPTFSDCSRSRLRKYKVDILNYHIWPRILNSCVEDSH